MNIANDLHNTNNSNVKIELVNDSQHKKEFLVVANAVEITQSVDADIAERAKTFKLAGFKKEGGAPISLVKRQIGKAVMSEHIDKLIQNSIFKIISENNLNISGMPSIDIKEFNPEGDIKIAIQFSIMASIPEIDLTNDKFKVELLELVVKSDDIQQAKDSLVKMMAMYKSAAEGHATGLGDAIIIDFHGKLNGEDFDGNQATQIRVDIGDGQFIKDFEDKLISLKKGDDKTLKVQFPNDYPEEKLAGQHVDFDVKVHDVLVKDEDADTENELLKRFEVESLENLETLIQEKILQDFNSIVRLRTKKLLFDKIDSEVNFELPEDMVKSDFENMWKDVSTKIASGEVKKSEEEAKNELQSIAKRRVKLGLILADVAKKNSITITDEDIENAKNAEKAKRPDNTAAIEEFFAKKENKDVLQGAILEEKVVDFILNKIQKNVVQVTTTEFNDKYAKEIQELIS